jgi:phage-related protein
VEGAEGRGAARLEADEDGLGAGVNELRLKGEDGIFRVFYIAKLADAVYVLHCFRKKTQQTIRPISRSARGD